MAKDNKKHDMSAPKNHENEGDLKTEAKVEAQQPLVKLVSKHDIAGVSYVIVSRPDANIVELVNPSKKDEDGKDLTFFFNTQSGKKVTKGDKGEWFPARGRLPGSKTVRKATPAPRARGTNGGLPLSSGARTVLDEYLELKGGDAVQLLSELVETHLGEEVKKARELAERRKNLPADLIDGLAGANDEVRKKVLELLRG